MREDAHRGAREPAAVDDRGVGERVRDHRVALADERRDHARRSPCSRSRRRARPRRPRNFASSSSSASCSAQVAVDQARAAGGAAVARAPRARRPRPPRGGARDRGSCCPRRAAPRGRRRACAAPARRRARACAGRCRARGALEPLAREASSSARAISARCGSRRAHALRDLGPQDLAVAAGEPEAADAGLLLGRERARERIAVHLEARVADHAVGLGDRVAARGEVALDEERVRGPERERAEPAQVALAPAPRRGSRRAGSRAASARSARRQRSGVSEPSRLHRVARRSGSGSSPGSTAPRARAA